MNNAERILRELDANLDHHVRLVLYGRAAIALGFDTAPTSVRQSVDVDAIIPVREIEGFQAASPATIDLVLTKMMRGADPIDTAELEFLLRHDQIKPGELEAAIAVAVIPELPELRELFEQAKPVVRALAQSIATE